jgi:PIN domain nuclease of toxin-antitoxin system
MKKYLLDTHTFIWAIVGKSKLSEPVLNLLQNNDNLLFVSAVSFWEIAIKHGKGKLDLENFQIKNISDYCRKLEIKQIPLTSEEAINYSNFPFSENHKDPFDRMLICQSIVNNYVLVSKDAKMAMYKDNGLKCVW